MKKILSVMCVSCALVLFGAVFAGAQTNWGNPTSLNAPAQTGGPLPYNGPAQSGDWGNPTSFTPGTSGGSAQTTGSGGPLPYNGPAQTTVSQPAASSQKNACDQTAKAIVDAYGGCSNIDSTRYKNVYGACCTLVTKVSLLQMLNDALADGVLSNAEKLSLLGALDRYLSAIPASTGGSSSGGGGSGDGVQLCGAINYGGGCETFTGNDPDLRNNSIGNDTVSSIIVPAGAIAALYEHINYEGGCETFTANAPDFRNELIGNDTVSSIIVGSSCRGGDRRNTGSSSGGGGGGGRCTPPTGCPSYVPWFGCGTCWPNSSSCHSRNTSDYSDDCTTCRKCP